MAESHVDMQVLSKAPPMVYWAEPSLGLELYRIFNDEPPSNSLEAITRNHVRRPRPARITIHHDESHPSHVDLPVTRGNLIGTFFSGGDITNFGLAR